MTPPRHLIRVEWEASRSFDEPDTRGFRARNFTNVRDAARQVAIIRAWPRHLTLAGVYRPCGPRDELGVEWEPLDPDLLPLDPDDAEEVAALAAARFSHPDPRVGLTVGAVPDLEQKGAR